MEEDAILLAPSGYQQRVRITLAPTSLDSPVGEQEAGADHSRSISRDRKYFGDPAKVWMVNFRVRDLDKIATQLQAAGIAVKVYPQSYPNGRFVRLRDPEGNPIELWQPKSPKTSS